MSPFRPLSTTTQALVLLALVVCILHAISPHAAADSITTPAIALPVDPVRTGPPFLQPVRLRNASDA